MRMPLLKMIPVLLCAYLALACTQASQGTAADDFFNGFIAVLNKGDHDGIAAFVTAHFASGPNPETRVARTEQLAKQGAPFQLRKTKVISPTMLSALVDDAHGMSLTMRAHLNDAQKVDRLMVAPGEAFDEAPPKDYSGWKDLATLVSDVRSDTGCPAMVVATIHDGQMSQSVSGERVLGKNDPARVDDVWSIGSIGKPLCSTVIGRLIEMGKLNWDTTLADALPGVPMRPEYKAVTFEQIMHQRGGIPQDLDFQGSDIKRIVAGATEPMTIRLNYAKDILSREPIGKPGEKFAYSNAGYALLGVIAERAMNKPYEQLVKELVFKPLGLSHSFTNADKLPEGRPSGHMPGPKGLEPVNFGGPLEIMCAPAGGGMYMSAGDLAKFGAAHLKGLRGEDGLLKSATVLRLHEALPADGIDYACGWGVETNPGIEKFHGHNGSNGTFRAQLCVFPKANLVITGFVNCGGENEPSPPLQAALAIAGRFAPASDAGK